MAGIGYAYEWGSVIATWRYIDYKFSSDSLIRTTSLSGPELGVTYRF